MISEEAKTAAKEKELERFKNEGAWPGNYIHVKTWPWVEGPRRYGFLYKTTLLVSADDGADEQFKSYEELVKRWMGD